LRADASVSNGQLVLAVDQNYDGSMVTLNPYNFTDCAFAAQVIQNADHYSSYVETGITDSLYQNAPEPASAYFALYAPPYELSPSQFLNNVPGTMEGVSPYTSKFHPSASAPGT